MAASFDIGDRQLSLNFGFETSKTLEANPPKPEQRLGNDRDQPAAPRQPAPAQVSGAPLEIKAVPREMVVGDAPRFWLIHSETGLAVPGQFSEAEAQAIARISREWDWEIGGDRVPICAGELLGLLGKICSPYADREEMPGGEEPEQKFYAAGGEL